MKQTRKVTLIYDSQRLDRRAPLFWRMYQARKTRIVTFNGWIINRDI